MSSQKSRVYTPEKPAKWAIKRVKDHVPIPTQCPCCGSQVKVFSHQEIYGRNYGDWPWMYACTHCDARVGMHPMTNLPLGTLAQEPLRKARIAVKNRFNGYWKARCIARRKAYSQLAKTMKISVSKCHFGMFSESQCQAADRAMNQLLSR